MRVNYQQTSLAGAVAGGSQYAYITGMNITASSMQGIITNTSGLNPSTGSQPLSVTVTGPACYCISGTPPALTSSACGAACPDTTSAGTYVVIDAAYSYQPIMPFFSYMSASTVHQTATVRVK